MNCWCCRLAGCRPAPPPASLRSMPVSPTAISRAIASRSVSAVSISASKHLRLQADFRRTEREGWGIAGAPFYTSSALLAAPFDDHTDTANFAGDSMAARSGRPRCRGPARSTTIRISELRWDNPYSGGGQGARAQAPDNKAQTVTLAGAYRLLTADDTVAERRARRDPPGRIAAALHDQSCRAAHGRCRATAWTGKSRRRTWTSASRRAHGRSCA